MNNRSFAAKKNSPGRRTTGPDASPGGNAQRAQEPAVGSSNETGMPDALKSGVESMSGMDLSDVRGRAARGS